jgi:hypothetical protein
MIRGKYIRSFLMLTVATCTSVFAESQGLVWPERHCATLSWPDGRETRIGKYAEQERFAIACEKPTSKCAMDGKPFPSKRPDDSSDYSALGQAFVNCTLGPSPVERLILNQKGKDLMLGEDPVPEMRRSFLQDCTASGNRRGADINWTKQACDCTWDLISFNMTKSEYVQFDAAVRENQNPTALPQYRRIQSKLDVCK